MEPDIEAAVATAVRRITGEQQAVQPRPQSSRLLQAVAWAVGIFGAVAVAGLVSGLITWGGIGTTVQQHDKRLDQIEGVQLDDGRALRSLVDQVPLLRQEVQDMRDEIREGFRRRNK